MRIFWRQHILPLSSGVLMRTLYTSLFYLITPLLLLRLYWRGVKAPDYRKRWTERLAIYQQQFPTQVIWIHAVSVGEAEAALPLICRLQTQYPRTHFLVTSTTPTGSKRVSSALKDTVSQVYLPYDLPLVVKRFLAVFKPKIALIMEKEIWPNLYAQCKQEDIPLLIINARLSAQSARAYQKIPTLIKPALAATTKIVAQTDEDKTRFIAIGANPKSLLTMGNLKFDLAIDDALIQQAIRLKQNSFANRFVWIIASTHAPEERIFLELYPQLKKQIPNLLLLLVPRHPERFNTVKQQAEKMRFTTCMRSTKQQCTAATDVYIADTMGELKLLYGVADVCFVGGSMVPIGGHNILEPAAMGVPVLFGRYMANFKTIAKNMLDAGAAIRCVSKEEIIDALVRLHDSPAYQQKMTTKATHFIQQNQGATANTADLVKRIIG